MRPEDMMDAISRIHDDNIEEFAQVRPARFQVPWGMVATVAVFCIVIASAVWLRGAGILPGGTTTEPEPTFSHPCTTLPPPTELTTVPPTTVTTAPPDSTVPQTTQTSTTQPPTTTEPDTPFDPVPAVEDSLAGSAELVFTHYQTTGTWVNDKGRIFDISIRIPALRPDSEGAKQINAQILRSMESELSGLRRAYLEKGYTSTGGIDYTYYQVGDILAVNITIQSEMYGDHVYKYHLNTATGESLERASLVGMNYLEWLYRSCAMLKTHIGVEHSDGCGMFVNTHMDENGQFWLTHRCLAFDAEQQQILFDPNAGGQVDLGQMYHWIFNVIADAAFAQQQSHHLQVIFAENAPQFLLYLSREVKECAQVIGMQLLYERDQEEIQAHIALCETLRDNATDPAIVQTAQLLIDAVDDPGAGSIWATCRAIFQSITDLDSALKLSKVLHHCCFADSRQFISYMYMLDEDYYVSCWLAILSETIPDQPGQLAQVATEVLATPGIADYERTAAETLLQILDKTDTQ